MLAAFLVIGWAVSSPGCNARQGQNAASADAADTPYDTAALLAGDGSYADTATRPTQAAAEEKVTEAAANPQGIEIPRYESSCGGQTIRHTGFTLSYDADYKTPQWVAWTLTRAMTLGTEKRSNNPEYHPDELESYRVRELFNRFMMLMERDYRLSRDVNHYAERMHITPKYLTNIVRRVTTHTPKTIIDQYAVLQLKQLLRRSDKSIKEIAAAYNFADVSYFCRYYKRLTGVTPQLERETGAKTGG